MLEDDDLETFKETIIKKREENRAKLASIEHFERQMAFTAALDQRKDDLYRKLEELKKRKEQEFQNESNTPKI